MAVSTHAASLASIAAAAAMSVVVDAIVVVIAHIAAGFLVLSRHFFLWACLTCPGPGMLVVGRW